MIGQTNKKIRSGKLNRVLRNNMSDAEQALWNVLRGRQVSGHKFRRQHPFSDYILDFVCLENKLVIEVDGGQHGQQAGYDENRTQELQAAGFCVLRFWNNEVLKEIESVKEKIGLVVQELQSHPPPNLPLEGGGVKKVAPLKGKESKVSTYALDGGGLGRGGDQKFSPSPFPSPIKGEGNRKEGRSVNRSQRIIWVFALSVALYFSMTPLMEAGEVHGQLKKKPSLFQETRKDPFSLPSGIRLLSKEISAQEDKIIAVTVTPEVKPIEVPLKLKAILIGDHIRLASIDRSILSIGDFINGEKVLEIRYDRVILEKEGKKRTLVLDQSPIKLTVEDR